MEIDEFRYGAKFETKSVVNRKPKFEDFYDVFTSDFAYLNNEHYDYYPKYLEENNKICIVFASSTTMYHIIEISPRIHKYDISDTKEKYKIINEYIAEFEEKLKDYYEGSWSVDPPEAQTTNLLTIDVDFIDVS